MMQPRLTAPEPHVEYFLDCAAEAEEIDACSYMTLRLYGDDAAIRKIIDVETDKGYRARRAKCLELAELANAIIPNLPPKRRGGLVRAGFHSISTWIENTAEALANWGIEDEIDGGCMIDFRKISRTNRRSGETFKRTNRRVRSPNYIRRYVKMEGPRTADHLIVLTRIMLDRARRFGLDYDPGIVRDYRAQLNHRRMVKERKNRRKTHAARKVIRRSLSTAVSILGQETVSSFLRGEEVRMLGTDIMLTLRKRGRLSDTGHGCLSVGLASRDGTALADLCTFIDKTPTLDQLTGFALWMQSGEEEAILQRANIVRIEEAGRGHPILAKRRQDQAVEAAQELARLLGPEEAARVEALMAGPEKLRGGLSSSDRRERNNKYWQETRSQWIEALVVLVIGYRNLPIFKQAGAL
jgi:hypothetical protein